MQNFYIDDFIMLYTANLFNILSPGANVTITICNSNTISRKAGMMTGMGIICSSSIRKGCTICGIGLIISKAFWLFQLVKYVGSAYLFYLGVQYFWRSIATQAENKNLHTILLNNSLGKSSMNHIQAFQVGFLTDVLNPQALFGFITIVSSTVRPETTFLVRLCYVLILICTSVVWYMLVAFLFSHPILTKKLYSSFPWIRRLSGITLICIAFKMLFVA